MMIELHFDDCTVILHDDRRAAGLNLLAAIQQQTAMRYRWICQHCGMPMLERQMVRNYRLMGYLECPLCRLQGLPQ